MNLPNSDASPLTPLRVILLEDKQDDALLLVHGLRRAGFDPTWKRVDSQVDYLACLDEQPDLILADFSLPQFDGLRALRLLQERGLDIPFIVVTGTIEEMALVCVREGADDYLLKDRLSRLGEAVRQALLARRLRAEKLRAEQDLRDREERLHAFSSALPDLAFILDENGRYVEVLTNQQHQLYNDVAALKGLHLSDAHPLAEVELFLEYIRRAVQTGRLQTVEYQMEMSVGRRWFEARLAPMSAVTESGQRLVVWLARDVTERKETEALRLEQAQLRLENELLAKQSQVLAQLNAEKDKFFTIVAHDLKGPFNPVLINAELLIESGETLDWARIQRISRRIYDSTQQIATLLENLLQWSRLQMGHIEYAPENVNLEDVFVRNVSLLAPTAQNKQIALQNLLPEALWVHADRYMLDTAVRNLLSNAVKFTAQGGKVTITARRQEVDGRSMVEVLVKDTGVGIKPEALKALFQLGNPHSTPGTDGEQGTGLGLIICAELVQKNQGQLHIDSEPGEGTVVRFSVPAMTK